MFIHPCKRVEHFQGPRAPKLPKGHQYLTSVIHHFSPSAPWPPACGQLSCALWDVSILASPTAYQLRQAKVSPDMAECPLGTQITPR